MRRRIDRAAALIFAAAITLSCATAKPRPSLQSEEQTIRELDRQWSAAASARDVDRFVNFYAADAVLLPANDVMQRGAAQIRSTAQGLFKAPGLNFSFEPSTIEVAKAGDMAYDVGTYRMSMDDPSGPINDRGKYLVIWKKINGQWKAIADAGNSDLPVSKPTQTVVIDVEPAGMAFTANPAASTGWADFNPPGFPASGKIALLHGDPSKKGDYTYRLKLPAGYVIPPHFHPEGEHITVLSGTFQFGIGERADQTTLVTYGPGDFIYIPAKAPHNGIVRSEVVLQLHGMGPTTRTLVGNR